MYPERVRKGQQANPGIFTRHLSTAPIHVKWLPKLGTGAMQTGASMSRFETDPYRRKYLFLSWCPNPQNGVSPFAGRPARHDGEYVQTKHAAKRSISLVSGNAHSNHTPVFARAVHAPAFNIISATTFKDWPKTSCSMSLKCLETFRNISHIHMYV